MNPKFLVLSILSSLRSSDKLISKNVARKLRRELESGRTLKGRRTLTGAERQARVNRLKAYEESLTKVVKKYAGNIVADAHTTRNEFRGNFQNIEQKLKKLDCMDEKLDKVLRFVSRKATAEDLGDHSSRELYDQYMADLENTRYLKSLVAPQASAEKSMAKKIATADLKKAAESPEVMEKLRQGQIQSEIFQHLLQDKLASRQVQKPSASEEFLEAATSGRPCSSAPPAAALTEQAAILAGFAEAPVNVEPVEEPTAAQPPVNVEPVEEPTAAQPPATPAKIYSNRMIFLQRLAESLGVAINRKKFADASYCTRHDLIVAAYIAMNAKEYPILAFGEPNAWLNEPMYRDFHRSCIKSINAGYTELDLEIQVDFAEEPKIEIMINRKRFGSNRVNQMGKIKVAYRALASVTSGPVARFGEPNNWLNCDMYEDLHLEVISELEKTGMVFWHD